MLLTYPTFYRKFGLRLLQQLMTPNFYDLAFLDLPQETIYHYLDVDGITLGPASDDYLFRNTKRIIPIDSVIDFIGVPQGNPRRAVSAINTQVRDYLHHHRQLKMMRGLEQAVRDKMALVVFNYAPLGRAFKYQQSFYANYYRWRNIFQTVVGKIEQTVPLTHRNHFIFTGAPKVIPSFQQIVQASEEVTQSNIKAFRDNNAFLLLELWRWLAGNREESLFAKIPADKLHLVNFVFQESGKWCVLNLGWLNGFRIVPEGEQSHEDELVYNFKTKLTGLQVAKRVLRMYMSTMELRTLTTKVDPGVFNKAEIDDGAIIATSADTDDDDDDTDVSTKQSDLNEPEIDTAALAREVNVLTGLPDIGDQQTLDDMDDAEYLAYVHEQDQVIDEDLKQLEEIVHRQHEQAEKAKPTIEAVVLQPDTASAAQHVVNLCDKLADDGVLSAGEHRRFERLANSYKTIIAPDGVSTLEQFSQISPEKLTIPATKPMVDSASVLDKSMLHSTLNEFDSRYIKDVLHRDHVNMVLSVQRAGVAVTNYKVEKAADILGEYEDHILKISPVVGVPSTLRFKLPVVKEDGTFTSNGVPYRLRKQRGELPIRKTSPDEVSLSTYYGKAFISRGRTEASDYGSWLRKQVTKKLLDKQQTTFMSPVVADVFDSHLKSPRNYSAVSMVMKGALVKGYQLNFDHDEVAATYPPEAIKIFEKNGFLLLGHTGDHTTELRSYLVIDRLGMVYTSDADKLVPAGSLEHFLDIDTLGSPIEYTSIRVFNKSIPIGIVLGLEMGLHNLLELLRVEARVVPAGEKLQLAPDEFALSFSDESIVINRSQRLACLILGGFNEFAKTLKTFSIYSFDKRGVYVNLLEANGLSTRYVREIDLMYQMFVDPISMEILKEMKEPTTFKGLLFRATQMLLDDQHPDALDPAYMRIKGYERLSGAIYSELVQSLRVHNGKAGKGNAQIEMKPYAVWKRITEDPAKMQVQEINPIKAIKEMEAATFAGDGGRNKRSMTKDTRAYHPNDMGTISESTVDSSDVGINVYTSANPQFTSLRGMSRRFDLAKDGPTALLSTSALLAPGSDHDDPKRVNFIAIQQEHAIACDGYHQFTVRTGYDSIVAQRTSELFAVVAKQPGVVRSVNELGIIVDYADGSAQGYTLGRRFGNAAGLTIAHTVTSTLTPGEKFEVGTPICYNTGFFEPDFFNPKQIVLKNALNVTTVLMESVDTHEDSSAISKKVSKKLTSRITKVKTIEVKFDQSVSALVQPGQEVDSETTLCLIEDAITANTKIFDASSIETLKAVSAQSPRAKVKGLVERVEVFYHGDKEDMSESLLELSNAADKELRKRALATGAPVYTGKVDGGFRIENNPLPVDSVAIRIYISTDVASGVGDKGVFANQMKTVHGRVIEEEIVTEDGTVVDAIFGMKSIEARIVESPIIIGTTNTLLRVIGQHAVDAYRGRLKK